MEQIIRRTALGPASGLRTIVAPLIGSARAAPAARAETKTARDDTAAARHRRRAAAELDRLEL